MYQSWKCLIQKHHSW
uniref:Uncharacterized protein n=1 Tax=Arundo donax TaxID=35708 RepID=A0A0A9BIE3_ARUDO